MIFTKIKVKAYYSGSDDALPVSSRDKGVIIPFNYDLYCCEMGEIFTA